MHNSSLHALIEGIWRVPAHLSAPDLGVAGEVGVIEVDATTGEALNLSSQQAAIE